MTSAITDFTQFNRMRLEAKTDEPAVLREVAGQFEAIFIETLLKNMRSSSLAEPIFGQSDQLEMYQGMMDQQLAVEMSSGRGIGLAEMLVRQLGGDAGEFGKPPTASQTLPVVASSRLVQRAPVSATLGHTPVTGTSGNTAGGSSSTSWTSPDEFVAEIWPHAKRAGKKLGVAPEALLAQVALETGWGEHVMRRSDGRSSFNLFGIKTSPDWSGASVTKATLEFKDGVALRRQASFRAYPDIAATFDDYAAFIGGKPRYASVLGSGSDTGRFATALQEAGYATDPHYARKIDRIVNGTAMRGMLQILKGAKLPPINEWVSRVSLP